MPPEVIAAMIGALGVVVGVAFAEIRSRVTQRAQQISMLLETLHNLSGSPTEIVTGASIALKFQKRDATFHDILIPVLMASSLRLSQKECENGSMSAEEKYALYVIWCVIGSIVTTRIRKREPDIVDQYSEFEEVQNLFLETSVGKSCGRLAMEKKFEWIANAD